MTTETILNIMVVAVGINAVATARFNAADRRVKLAEFGVKYGITATITAFVMLGLWIWLAFATGYWQFAALVAVPMLITFGGVVAAPKTVGVSR